MPVPNPRSKVGSDNQKVKFLTIFGRPKTGICRRFRGVLGGPNPVDMDTLAARIINSGTGSADSDPARTNNAESSPGGRLVVGILHRQSKDRVIRAVARMKQYREAGITWFRMSRNYMVSEKWSSWEVVVFPSDHF